MDGKVWRGHWATGNPDAVYEDGKIWLDRWKTGTPDAVYEGFDSGGVVAAILLSIAVLRVMVEGTEG
jgi:hypothetical protein